MTVQLQRHRFCCVAFWIVAWTSIDITLGCECSIAIFRAAYGAKPLLCRANVARLRGKRPPRGRATRCARSCSSKMQIRQRMLRSTCLGRRCSWPPPRNPPRCSAGGALAWKTSEFQTKHANSMQCRRHNPQRCRTWCMISLTFEAGTAPKAMWFECRTLLSVDCTSDHLTPSTLTLKV